MAYTKQDKIATKIGRYLLSAAIAGTVVASAVAPAWARDWDDHHDWRHHEWREHAWREHAWGEHHRRAYQVYPYVQGYVPGYAYAPPPPVYAPPPAVYAAPPPAYFSLGLNFH